MKEKWYQKLKRKWDELPDDSKKVFFGGLIGGFCTSLVSGLVISHRDQKWIDAGCNYAEEESKKAYLRGIQDGQVKAYKDLILNPETAFKKMGMEKTFKF